MSRLISTTVHTAVQRGDDNVPCDLCTGSFGSIGPGSLFCPVLLACRHSFCTKCTLKKLDLLCPVCAEPVNEAKLRYIESCRHDYALEQAACFWDDEKHAIRFQGYNALDQVDKASAQCQNIAKIAASFLRQDLERTYGSETALIDVTALAMHLVVISNMLQALRAAKKERYTLEQSEQWRYIVAGTYSILASQAKHQTDMQAETLTWLVRKNMQKAVKFDLASAGYAHPGSQQYLELSTLVAYVVHICVQAYAIRDQHSSKQPRASVFGQRRNSVVRRLSRWWSLKGDVRRAY